MTERRSDLLTGTFVRLMLVNFGYFLSVGVMQPILPLYVRGPLHESDVGVGTTFNQTNMLLGRRFRSEMRVVTYEPPRLYEYTTTSGPIRFTGHYTFAPTGDGRGTSFTSVDESEPSGLLRYLQPLLQPFAQRQITANLARLKAVCE